MLISSKRSKFAMLLPLMLLGCAQADEADAQNELAQMAPRTPTVTPTARPTALEQLDIPVSLRGTGSATIHATIYNNERNQAGQTVLAVHGLSETGSTFEPLSKALFADPAVGNVVQRVIAIDLTGHGRSSMPQNLPASGQFGSLTIDDNVSVVVQVIKALRAQRLAPQIIVGHSMGGLAVQAVQESLLAQGSSLAKEGVSKAVLLAPVPAHGQTWTQPASGGEVSAFVVQDATLGAYLSLPPAVWVAQSFTTTLGKQVANAPTPEQVTSKGYSAFEPLVTLLQLLEAPMPLPSGGTTTVPRPSVRAGAFGAANGTTLTLVSFKQDTLVPSANLSSLYTHLTGDTTSKRYVEVTTDDAVHGMFISNPTAMLAATRSAL